jgi:transcriptional regulator with XRE-family HTH domain
MGKQTNAVDGHVGARVARARAERGITQRDLAAAIGVTYQQLQKYERGLNRIGAGRLYAVSEALGVPISYFFMGIEKADRPETPKPIRRMSVEAALEGAIPDEAARAIAGLCKAIAQSKRAS